jgi:hypothetical protein
MSNRPAPQINSNFNTINNSPFTKMKKINQNINKINVICEGNPIKQIKTIHDNQINNSPFQFDVNLYFGKSSFTPRYPMDNYYSHHNDIHQNMPICLLFKASLEKSGYKLTPEQTVQYKDVYKKYNSINSFYDDFNYCYLPIRDIPINSNNNIINNIYPTFTKVTNVQILSYNENNKNNNLSTEKNKYNIKNNIVNLENKKENIQNIDNIMKKDSSTVSTKEEKKSINNNISIIINGNTNNDSANKKQKVLFECSESNTPNTSVISKNFIKKKRLRKNNEQLGLLSKFYLENKNWSKKQIKEMSENIGLKENKIYKWLWDQKNKEYKITKFVVNKDKDKDKNKFE